MHWIRKITVYVCEDLGEERIRPNLGHFISKISQTFECPVLVVGTLSTHYPNSAQIFIHLLNTGSILVVQYSVIILFTIGFKNVLSSYSWVLTGWVNTGGKKKMIFTKKNFHPRYDLWRSTNYDPINHYNHWGSVGGYFQSLLEDAMEGNKIESLQSDWNPL